MTSTSSPADDAIREHRRGLRTIANCPHEACEECNESFESVLRDLVETVQRSQSDIERRDERRKALLEACAAVCEWCEAGITLMDEPTPDPSDRWYHVEEDHDDVDCDAWMIRALLVVEGEPEQKEGA